MKKIHLGLFTSLLTCIAFGQNISFEQVAPLPPAPTIIANFDAVQYSSIAFADIDNDNDQDVLITGEIYSIQSIARLYRNISCNPTSGIDTLTGCDSLVWIDGNTYTSNNNTATYTLTNAAGCDSVVTLNLTIITVDVSVTTTDPTITANATGATYQWLDCSNSYAVITGETAQSFTASVNGDYAVEVTKDICSDTSACITISTVGIEENTLLNSVSIFPNPNQGLIYIDLGNLKEVTIKVFSVSGQLIYKKENINASIHQFEFNEAPGVYFIEVSSQGAKQHYKLVKK